MNNIKLSYKLIFGLLGIFLIFVGVTCLLPLLVLIFYPSESHYWINFLIPGISSIVLGTGLSFLIKGTRKAKLGKFQDAVLLVLIWVFAIIICAIPFFMREDMNFTQAVFETTSGFSTIGLTVFKDFDCHIYVFWRSLLTLIGGVGIVLVLTTAISNRFAFNLYTAEGHNDKLLPNLRKTAVTIFAIYLGIILLGSLAYFFIFKSSGANTGEEFFDGLIHSISAVATGGFSSRAGGLLEIESIYANREIAIEIVSVILMLAGSINFLTHFFLVTGKFSKAWKDCEVRMLLCMICVCVPIFFVTTLLGNTQNYSWFESLRYGGFSFISSITTTGFSNIENIQYVGQATMLMIVIMNVIGGGAGSTAGGVKQYRFAVACKSVYWGAQHRFSFERKFYPHFIFRGGEEKEVTPSDSIEAFSYIFLYVAFMIIGGLLVTIFSQCTFGDGVFEFSNAISSTGLSNGLTNKISNCANWRERGTLWTLTAGMFFGRLEIMAIFYAILRMIRDIAGKETY